MTFFIDFVSFVLSKSQKSIYLQKYLFEIPKIPQKSNRDGYKSNAAKFKCYIYAKVDLEPPNGVKLLKINQNMDIGGLEIRRFGISKDLE